MKKDKFEYQVVHKGCNGEIVTYRTVNNKLALSCKTCSDRWHFGSEWCIEAPSVPDDMEVPKDLTKDE